MKRKICPACSRSFLVGKKAFFAARTGLRACIVCAECIRKGTTIVNDRTADARACVECLKHDAVVCLACALKTQRRHKRAINRAMGPDLTLEELVGDSLVNKGRGRVKQ